VQPVQPLKTLGLQTRHPVQLHRIKQVQPRMILRRRPRLHRINHVQLHRMSLQKVQRNQRLHRMHRMPQGGPGGNNLGGVTLHPTVHNQGVL
jgi:hypothetical protein